MEPDQQCSAQRAVLQSLPQDFFLSGQSAKLQRSPENSRYSSPRKRSIHSTSQRRPSRALVEQGVQTPQLDQMDATGDQQDVVRLNHLAPMGQQQSGSKKVIKLIGNSLDMHEPAAAMQQQSLSPSG